MSSNVTLSNYIQIACLPVYTSTSYPGYDLTAWAAGMNIFLFILIFSYLYKHWNSIHLKKQNKTGWGTTSYGGLTSTILRNVQLTIYLGSIYCRVFGITNWNSQICAGEYNGGN